MSDTVISRSELSRRVGRSRQFISEAIDKGRIGMLGVGKKAKVNLSDGLTAQFIETCRFNDKDPAASLPAGPVDGMNAAMPEIDYDMDINLDGFNVNNLSKVTLDRVKLLEAIRWQKQRTAEKRGELLPRKSAQKVFHKLFMVHSNQLRPFGSNVTPDISAIYQSDNPEHTVKTEAVITKEIFKVLSQIKRDFNKWLTDNKMEEIPDDSE